MFILSIFEPLPDWLGIPIMIFGVIGGSLLYAWARGQWR